ncbi:MAG: hypothetical protein JNL90_17610 [Planctomycetes bacterium]|nr:hypothetical protein [Planctomycetota bacterium]
MHPPLLVVAWPWTLLALAAAVAAGGAAFLLQVALLARSCGEGAVQAQALLQRGAAWRAWRARVVPLGALATVGFVVALAGADSGTTRAAALAVLLGVALVAGAGTLAHHFALLVAARVPFAADDGAARKLEDEGARAASRSLQACVLLGALALVRWHGDRLTLPLLAAAAAATAALLRTGGSEAHGASTLEAAALAAARRAVSEAAVRTVAFALVAREQPALALALAATLPWLASWRRRELRGLPAFELVACAIVPLFVDFPAAAPDGASWASERWPAARVTLPLWIGLALAAAIGTTVDWWCDRPLPAAASGAPRSAVPWLLIWLGSAWMVGWQWGGDMAPGWSAFALLFATPPRRESAAPVATPRAIEALGGWLLALAGVLAIVAPGGERSPAGALLLGALLLGALVGELLGATLCGAGAAGAISTRGGARAMILPSSLSAAVAFGLSRIAPALQGGVLAGMLVVGFVAALPALLPARDGPAPSERGSEAGLAALVPWWLALVFLVLAAAPHGR